MWRLLPSTATEPRPIHLKLGHYRPPRVRAPTARAVYNRGTPRISPDRRPPIARDATAGGTTRTASAPEHATNGATPPPAARRARPFLKWAGGKTQTLDESKRLHAGRGPVGKVAVAGVKDRATGRVSAAVVERTDGATLKPFVLSRVAQEADIYTDEHGIESFWSMLKRGYYGAYHRMSPKHLPRYVAEFAGHHNIRDRDTLEQMAIIPWAVVGKRLKYADLIA